MKREDVFALAGLAGLTILLFWLETKTLSSRLGRFVLVVPTTNPDWKRLP